MRKGDCKKRGQVWAEKWGEGKEVYFLVLSQDQDFYQLLCLEDATEDKVFRRTLDKPLECWRRVT